ncbi:unnamed protein product, partial [Urochloa humidicola]
TRPNPARESRCLPRVFPSGVAGAPSPACYSPHPEPRFCPSHTARRQPLDPLPPFRSTFVSAPSISAARCRPSPPRRPLPPIPSVSISAAPLFPFYRHRHEVLRADPPTSTTRRAHHRGGWRPFTMRCRQAASTMRSNSPPSSAPNSPPLTGRPARLLETQMRSRSCSPTCSGSHLRCWCPPRMLWRGSH